MADPVKLSNDTIKDLSSVEYQWVRALYVEGYKDDEINHYIRTCFGGDEVFANLFRKVALDHESLYVLMRHLGCAPSSLERL